MHMNNDTGAPDKDLTAEKDTTPENTEAEVRAERIHDAVLLCCGAVFLLACVVLGVCRMNKGSAFSEFVCTGISAALRKALAFATSFAPFSVCEALAVAAVLYIIVRAVTYAARRDKFRKTLFFKRVTSAALVIASCVYMSYAVLFTRKPVNEYIGLDREEVSADDLTLACGYVTDKLNGLVERREVYFDPEDFSEMPYSFSELGDKVNAAYASLTQKEEYSFLTKMNVKAKPLLVSKYMTYTHMSGVYTPVTGEANINLNYPDYVIAFTYAHELAHQRGVAPEDEANFMAYLVLLESDDPYLNYSAYRYVLDYLQGALFTADYDKCVEVVRGTAPEILREETAYSAFFDKYRDSGASKVADVVNDTNLKLNDQTAGVRSYGLVTDLVVAHIKAQTE